MSDRLRAAWGEVAERIAQPFGLRIWHVLVASLLLGVLLVGVVTIFALVAFQLNDTQNRDIEANRRAILNNRRLDRLERPPNDRELALAAARALRACVADAVCRSQLRGAIRRTNLRPRDVPSLRPRPSTTPGGGGNGSGSGGTGSGQGGTSPGSSTTPPTSRSPSANRPPAAQPTVPPRTPPSAPRPGGSAPTPGGSRPPTPPTPATPIPVPRPPPPVPSVPAPPPPVTVTTPVPLPPLCTPVVQVNCRSASGRLVGPGGAEADPESNSGRGNGDDRLCDRVKAPCDDAGNPVFPGAIIRLP